MPCTSAGAATSCAAAIGAGSPSVAVIASHSAVAAAILATVVAVANTACNLFHFQADILVHITVKARAALAVITIDAGYFPHSEAMLTISCSAAVNAVAEAAAYSAILRCVVIVVITVAARAAVILLNFAAFAPVVIIIEELNVVLFNVVEP